jgi:hypothetical protein
VATAARVGYWRAGAAAVAFAVLGWIAYETIHAGSDIPPSHSDGPTRLTTGEASGKRIDGKSWSLDYDSAVMTPDGSGAEIDNVHDGVIFRNGKPYMHMRARHVSANLDLNDFQATGPVSFVEIGGRHRRLDTIDAHYEGNVHTLVLTHPTTIREDGASVTVASASINFLTGETKLGRIAGNL